MPRLLKITCFRVGLLTLLQSLMLLPTRANSDPIPFMVLLERQRNQHRLIAYAPQMGWQRNITPLMDNFRLVARPDGGVWGMVTTRSSDDTGGQPFGRPYVIDWARLNITPIVDLKIPAVSLRATPDGQWVVFFAANADGTVQVMRVRPDGSDPLNLTAQFDPPPSVNVWEWPVVSAEWVYFSGQTTEYVQQIYRVRLDGTGAEVIDPAGTHVWGVMFATPDGEWVVVKGGPDWTGMLPVDTNQPFWFVYEGRPFPAVEWWITPGYFVAGGTMEAGVWQAGESDPVWILDDVARLAVSHDDLIFTATHFSTLLRAISPDGERRYEITPPDGLVRSEIWAWSPDGQWLIFAGEDEVNDVREVWRQRVSDGTQEKIASFAGYIAFQGVTPDDGSLLYTDIGRSGKRLYRMRADGTGPTLIAPNDPAWEYTVVGWHTLARDWSASRGITVGVTLLLLALLPLSRLRCLLTL